VILFWMSGGPGHHETWDPKPDAVPQIRGPFGATRTNVPGLLFGELMPRQAKIADKIAVVRSVAHGSGDHTKGNHWMLTGFEGPAFNVPDFRVQRRPCLGSAAAKLRGANRPGMPAYAAVPHLRGGTDNFFHYAAYLGPKYNPFVTESDPNKPDYRVRNLALPPNLSMDRLEDRREVLGLIDRLKQSADAPGLARDASADQAFELLTSRDVAAAFDINAESAEVRDKYGRHTFGQSALLARRLVEAGVTFVTVQAGGGWDTHGDNFKQLKTKLLPQYDAAVAALVEDLHDRGLQDEVLVMALGEFGRTPKVNGQAGRDHWPGAMSVLYAGGGLKMGQAVGTTNALGEYPTSKPATPGCVLSTMYHAIGVDYRHVFHDDAKRPLPVLSEGEPVKELVG